VRAFVAVRVVEPSVVEALREAQRILSRGSSLRLTPPHQLHFTLKFLGEIDADRVDAAKAAVVQAAAGIPPFEVTLTGVGAFPRAASARVLWAGCSGGADQLVSLGGRVEAAFVAAGFATDTRPFSPHLTVARVREGGAGGRLAEAIRQEAGRAFGTIRVSEVALMKSVLGRSGADHSPVVVAPLTPGSASG